MRYGVCGDPVLAAGAAKAGYDYFEWSVGALLKPREPEAAFAAALSQVRAAPIPCPVVNCFLPADLKVTGPQVDSAALRAYVATACERAQRAGVAIIVFGSGGARQIPEGFARRDAQDQLASFCGMAGPIAQQHGVTIVVEPLNRQECNVLNTVRECAELVRKVSHPAVRLLVDAYHLLRDDDATADIAANGDLLAHVHIATKDRRLAPGAEPCDFAPFFAALAQAGYNGRISIEGSIPEPATQLPAACALLHSQATAKPDRT